MSNIYSFTDKTKKITFALMGIGVLAIVYALVRGIPGQRIWANILVDSFFFLGIAAAATFFMALQYATESAYGVTTKRVYEAVGAFLPVGGLLLLLVIITGAFGVHHLYHWMDAEEVAKDEILQAKQGYLNVPFFLIRTLAYLLIWILFQRGFVKRSRLADETGDPDYKLHDSNVKNAAIFLILFGVTSSASAWDWMMSIDAHWYSTMFGWYVFSGMWISAIIMLIFFVLFLKRKGYLQEVNESHMHDLGKWMFAVSFLWTYLWFCQFMLIWYANIPEEVTYFVARFADYKSIMWPMFFINFAVPMVLLMSRDAKRNMKILSFVAPIIFFTHWVDVYQMVMPGTVGSAWRLFSPFEIGLMLGFLGLFLFVVHTALTKAPLVVKTHPYLEESLHHEV